MLALCSRVIVLFGRLVSLKDCKKDKSLLNFVCVWGGLLLVKVLEWFPSTQVFTHTYSYYTHTSLRARRCWVLSGAAGLSDLNPQWCGRWMGTEDFLDREGYVVPSPSTWAEAAFDRAFLPSARWGAWSKQVYKWMKWTILYHTHTHTHTHTITLVIAHVVILCYFCTLEGVVGVVGMPSCRPTLVMSSCLSLFEEREAWIVSCL